MQVDDITAIDSWKEIGAFLVIARFYALNRFAALLSSRVDTEGYAVEGDRDTIFDHVMDLIKEAAAEAATYGYVLLAKDDTDKGSANDPVDQDQSTSNWRRGAWQTDYIDPIVEGYYPI